MPETFQQNFNSRCNEASLIWTNSISREVQVCSWAPHEANPLPVTFVRNNCTGIRFSTDNPAVRTQVSRFAHNNRDGYSILHEEFRPGHPRQLLRATANLNIQFSKENTEWKTANWIVFRFVYFRKTFLQENSQLGALKPNRLYANAILHRELNSANLIQSARI